jgi:hypothetical protein
VNLHYKPAALRAHDADRDDKDCANDMSIISFLGKGKIRALEIGILA